MLPSTHMFFCRAAKTWRAFQSVAGLVNIQLTKSAGHCDCLSIGFLAAHPQPIKLSFHGMKKA